jgi:hypothetical protein
MQIARIALKFRVRFQNDMILVDLGVEGVDLPLSKGIVKSVVYRCGSDAKA